MKILNLGLIFLLIICEYVWSQEFLQPLGDNGDLELFRGFRDLGEVIGGGYARYGYKDKKKKQRQKKKKSKKKAKGKWDKGTKWYHKKGHRPWLAHIGSYYIPEFEHYNQGSHQGYNQGHGGWGWGGYFG